MRAILLAIGVAALVAAPLGAASAAPPSKAQSKNFCLAGFDTKEGQLRPPDGTPADNPNAGSIRAVKTCRGAVVARFSSEVSAPASGDFIDLLMEAKCLRGRTSDPCTVGEVVYGSPGGNAMNPLAFARGPIPGIANYSAQWVFRDLKPGVWLFQVRPGGNDKAFMVYRSLAIEAYEGG